MTSAPQSIRVNINELLDGLVESSVIQPHADFQVAGLAQDSRSVEPGFMFIAFAGHASHGLLYAKDAVERGAGIILWDGECENADGIIQQISAEVPCLQCHGLREKAGEIASRFYACPSDELHVVGVTGTDGKTSISHFIAQCLDTSAARCGLLGTLGNGFIGQLKPTGFTTANAVDVQHSLADLYRQGARSAVMEVSSHGLDQGRINAVLFDVAVFSNFSQDHLDYHETLEKYAEAKSKLFSMPGLSYAVINLDDAFGLELAEKTRKRLCVWGYSLLSDVTELKQYADFIVHAESVEKNEGGFSLVVKTPKGSANFRSGLLGTFNISNILATLTTLLVSDLSLDDAVARVSMLMPVAGRMEVLSVQGKPVTIVDYAHTPKGLESACRAVKEHFKGRLWCVFGCGGNRDKGKRPLMARVAERLADRVVVTNDNPRHEDPQEIIEDILEGLVNKDKVDVIADRKQAIEHAISLADEDDVVLLAGKGHETSQIVGDTYFDFDDRLVAGECLGMVQ